MTSPSQRARPTAIWIVAGVAVVVATVWALVAAVSTGNADNPVEGKTLYVYPDSSAATALGNASSAGATGGDLRALTRLAETPTAIWLLPEAHSTATVGAFVSGVAADAEAHNRLPVFVIYGIPNRDCDNESAGGLSAQEYPVWVSAIGRGLADRDSIVILEPDSLSLAGECGNVDERVAEVRSAVSALTHSSLMLSGPAASIYLDGGHSTWLPAETMAPLLERAGIAQVRGFASNTANYNSTESEIAYGDRLSALTNGAHYVIDISRNGNGSNGQWCNPVGRALGQDPGPVSDGSERDANLWIKNPGESDGSCNGGPPAGQWWELGALALANG